MPVVLGNPAGSLGTAGLSQITQLYSQLAQERWRQAAERRAQAARQQQITQQQLGQVMGTILQMRQREQELNRFDAREQMQHLAIMQRDQLRAELARDKMYMNTIGMPYATAAAEAERLGVDPQRFFAIAAGDDPLLGYDYSQYTRQNLRELEIAEREILDTPGWENDSDLVENLTEIRQQRAQSQRTLIPKPEQPKPQEILQQGLAELPDGSQVFMHRGRYGWQVEELGGKAAAKKPTPSLVNSLRKLAIEQLPEIVDPETGERMPNDDETAIQAKMRALDQGHGFGILQPETRAYSLSGDELRQSSQSVAGKAQAEQSPYSRWWEKGPQAAPMPGGETAQQPAASRVDEARNTIRRLLAKRQAGQELTAEERQEWLEARTILAEAQQ